MSATFPADVFITPTVPAGEWISEKPVSSMTSGDIGCYVSMNREFGARPTLETVHECALRTDVDCPVGVSLELEHFELECEIEANAY